MTGPAGNPDREELRRLYLAGTIEGVAIVNADAAACTACRALGERAYLPWELPELPVASCISPRGCRCGTEAMFTVVE